MDGVSAMQNNSVGRFRKKRVNFAMVSNEAIRNENLSLKAKGLYALIQSYITIEDFTLYKSFLLSQCKEGKKSFETAWKELKDNGYLVQYRMQDAKTKHFFWEYELLDVVEPVPQNGSMAQKPVSQKGVYGKGNTWQTDDMPNGGDINNIEPNNTLSSYIESNHILSTEDVRKQIGYEAFDKMHQKQVDEIVLLILDVMNTPDESQIRINRLDIVAYKVKERYRTLNQSHIGYVLETLSRQVGTIGNIRAYLLTTLYNAPVTMDSFYQNWVNHDMYGD